MSTRIHPGPWLGLAVACSVLAGVAGVWHAALTEERAVLDRLQQQLAQHAGAYLGVVTPAGAAGGYDPARLLSGANALAGATFWPGGLQLVLGSTALIPDAIGLLPLPDSIQRAVDRGAPMLAVTHPKARVVLVPFLGPQSTYLGWVATWDAVPRRVPSPLAVSLTGFAVIAAVITVVAAARRGPVRRPLLALATMALALVLLGTELQSEVRQVRRAAIQTRLQTVRKLIELAATAERVRQADLPAIAVDIGVAPRRGIPLADSGVVWSDSVASISAATPRTQSSLLLAVPRVVPGGVPSPRWFLWYLLPALGALVLLLARWRDGR